MWRVARIGTVNPLKPETPDDPTEPSERESFISRRVSLTAVRQIRTGE
jgi:hypothetical protein